MWVWDILMILMKGTPSTNALRYGSPSILELLLDAGADPNTKDKYRKTPLQYAIEWLDPKDGPEYGTFINMLIKKGRI